MVIGKNKIIQEIFQYQVANEKKLIEYGFIQTNQKYFYSKSLLHNQFILYVWINQEKEIETQLIEKETMDEYILHLVDKAQGAFVGEVREAYIQCLQQICSNCFEREIFQGVQAKKIISYVKEQYEDDLEFLWKDTEAAIWRRKDNKKWYGLMMNISKEKLGLPFSKKATILNLRISFKELENVLDDKKYFRAYHMNKKHWISLLIDEISFSEIIQRISNSYLLAQKKIGG